MLTRCSFARSTGFGNDSKSPSISFFHLMKLRFKRILRWCRNAVLALFVFSLFMVLVYKWLPVPFTPLMFIRALDPETPQMKHHWVSIDKISHAMPLAVVASEDNRFMTHHGFDHEQIRQAMEEAKRGGRKRGASTISQQTAKNVFLWPGRSWIRKGLEAYFTVLIEFVWGKERKRWPRLKPCAGC